MQKITPFLMFQNNPQEAISFYLSIFPEGKDLGGGSFELMGQKFLSFNGGTHFTFSEGMSLFISCKDQDEIDYYWAKLGEGGQEGMCGWIKDKYGIWWQVVPEVLSELMSNPEKSQKVMEVFLKMKKFDIQALLNA